MPVSSPTRHLVTVWNPSYADAMDATIELLLERARDFRAGKLAGEEDVYVWWGKVKSSNRQQRMPHLAEILSIDEDLNGADGPSREVHLYITDYRSLYVAHVAEVTEANVREDEDDEGAVPAFYAAANLSCDCWFRLWDIRRVIADDTRGVVEELKKLSNTRYNGRPVSIYGGMVDLPLIVTRPDGARFFEADVRAALTEGRFWVEFDATRSGIGQMEQELRENLLGDSVWEGLDPAARSFIATAETLFRNHRNDAAFDFGPIVVDFAKAFELQVNLLVRRGLSDATLAERSVNVDGRTVDLTSGELLTLGQLAQAIGETQQVNRILRRRLAHGEWFATSLPPILRDLGGRRNRGAHSEKVGKAEATELRNRLMGVGCAGVVGELGRVR